MEIADQLKESQEKQKEVVEQIEGIDRRRQELLQEVLRLDGEIRVLKKLIEE